MKKRDLRNLILEKRAKLSLKEHSLYSKKIIEKIFLSEEYKNAKNIMTFISFSDEVNTHEFIRKSIADGKNISVPVTFPEEKVMKPSILKDFSELELGHYNILSPKKEFLRYINPESLDLIIVPTVAFDYNGYRVGYGGGYYDRFLEPLNNVITIGIAFDLQLVPEVPKDDYDIPVDYIYTEDQIISCLNY